ncbi:hypothetical protein DCM90_06110 [Levilactobacillus bambusae]|uniref:Uncharacterized protein n=2 Tax=Levilactobacillus bambusae TaxID=2024736 RepID=A0A2V1MZT3_9LACO|nr:hypothetical protein DCM90_06110 [Levilactobacillus bambusae]
MLYKENQKGDWIMKSGLMITSIAVIILVILTIFIYVVYGNKPDQLANIGRIALIETVASLIIWLSI